MNTEVQNTLISFVAELLACGCELGSTVIPIAPEKCSLWFAYSGTDSNREFARVMLIAFVEFMYCATGIEIEQYQYAKSRFKFRVNFSSYIQINPAHFVVETKNINDMLDAALGVASKSSPKRKR